MTYGVSNSYVIYEATSPVKCQSRDPNRLSAQYLEVKDAI